LLAHIGLNEFARKTSRNDVGSLHGELYGQSSCRMIWTVFTRKDMGSLYHVVAYAIIVTRA
jgi:hypothetical protein